MKRSGLRLLLLVALLFSLSIAAYSECLYNGSFDLAFTENKIVVEGEVALVQSEIIMTDFVSVAPIPSSVDYIMVLWNCNIIMMDNRRKVWKRLYKHDFRIRSPDDLIKAA